MTKVTDERAPARVGPYELRGELGRGGMGVVYEGYDPVIGKRVAVKVLRPDNTRPNAADELLAEAKLVNAVEHRGVVQLFAGGKTDDGGAWLAMEYLSGVTLDAHLDRHQAVPLQDALQILDEVVAALGAAHQAAVIHRDLKPSNIFLVVQPDGSTYVKLLDFGLAKASSFSDGKAAQTSATHVRGTPHYMAPEQIRGHRLGPTTDLYAVGVVAYELLTGQLPFGRPTVAELLDAHLSATPRAPSELVPGLPPDVDRLVLGLLEKDESRRPQTAEDVRAQIKFIRAEKQFAASTRLVLPPFETAEPVPPSAPPRITAAPSPGTLELPPPLPVPAPRRETEPEDVSVVHTTTLKVVPSRIRRMRLKLALAFGAVLGLVAVAWVWVLAEPPPTPQLPEPLPPLSEVAPIPVEPTAPLVLDTPAREERPKVLPPLPQMPQMPRTKASAKQQTRRRTLNLTRTSKASPLLQRLERVRAAFAVVRRSMPASQAKPYDEVLDYCEDQLDRAEQTEAARCIDEFVRLVLDGREP
ncbi:MAG: serine/threonine protein kinase [Myxococcaceae bacterium]|nr:serine/threonine protein kinase [Myxococcaceae bacterium]